ncbi:hypothetical protein [Streptomyces canus]|nr:hypothetical protein [Streptomyces canus]MDQ0764696.1 hypothetical protein [Streptomyces canus]
MPAPIPTARVQAPRPLRLDRLTEPLEVVGESAQFGGEGEVGEF